eukprot:CAMPEP_0182484050 /NCGR_PEP_ID=MMETSP1319-20130603/42650_1 /TAXON_ID=172717 /ORGANISM="Bolidomonas pacifica, Strain RCC208" /LENGTH=71 /DNA_ID=CAMNT_0024685915 /DNA_START=108 /DNA_END=323 /DNA_ORIENTATION=+
MSLLRYLNLKSSSRTPPPSLSTISTCNPVGLRVSCKDPSPGPSPPPPSTTGLELTPESSIAQGVPPKEVQA